MGNHDEYSAFLGEELVHEEQLHEGNMQSHCRALEYLYNHPWFQRVWIQQEVFASRNLTLKIGQAEISWIQINLRYDRLAALYQISQEANHGSDIPFTLDVLKMKTHCFARVLGLQGRPMDLGDALMEAAGLQATNLRDYIYGIIGMSHTELATICQLTSQVLQTFLPSQ